MGKDIAPMKVRLPRGTYDMIPMCDSVVKNNAMNADLWSWIEYRFREVCRSAGLREVRTPIFEQLELFYSLGEGSDIVQHELFAFKDKGDRMLALRPEGTAPCMRMCCEHNLWNQDLDIRMFYIEPMFRYERPQAGRYRQHWQCGLEITDTVGGYQNTLEVLRIIYALMNSIELPQGNLRINYISDANTRAEYENVLREYLLQYEKELSENSQQKLKDNVLRVLDSKDDQDQRIIEGAPCLHEVLSETEMAAMQDLVDIVKNKNWFGSVSIDPRLVRGLSYYKGFVFEVSIDDQDLGAHISVAGGGGYEIVEGQQLVGMGMGLERIIRVLEKTINMNSIPRGETVRIICSSSNRDEVRKANLLLETLRQKGISTAIAWDAKWGKQAFVKSARNGVKLLVGISNSDTTIKNLESGNAEKTSDFSNVFPNIDRALIALST